MRSEWPLPLLLGGLRCGLALLHDFIDRERLPQQALALGRLHGSTTNLRIANHDDREAFGLARLGVGDEHGVLDRHERREQLPHLLDLDTGVKVANVDLEHGHGRNSRRIGR